VEIPPIGRATKVWYGVGQAAEGIKNHAFSTFLFFFYTAVMGLSGTMVSFAIAIALLFDAISDPLAGALSDRLNSRHGRRHPFMYASALPLAVFFYLAFAPPAGLSDIELGAYLAVFAVLTRGAMTLYHVPHMSLGAELSTDYEERTEIVKSRSLFQQLGVLTCAGMMLLYFMRATPEFDDGRFNPQAYADFALFFGVVMFVVIIASAWKTRDRIPFLSPPDTQSRERGVIRGLLSDMREALSIPSFRALFLGTTLLFVAVGVAVNVGMHINTYFWKITTEQIALVSVGAAFGLIGGILFWPRVAARIDKKPTFLIGFVIFTAFASGPLILGAIGWFPTIESPIFLPLLSFTWFAFSFGSAAPMVTSGSMMADITDEDELIHGRRREGIFFGASAFSAKASVGLGALIAGPIVDLAGFEKGMDVASVPVAVGQRLALIDGLTIGLVIGLATLLFARYSLNRNRHSEIRVQLDARASAG
jgi:Na+/melibiose symporter-like transporter